MSHTLFDTDDPIASAVLSPCGRYRYRLSRAWDYDRPPATFLMLNPSTADANQDDPTIRRCTGFAKTWGLGGIVVVNLYALRSTDPAGLWADGIDPVGPLNDRWLATAATDAALADSPLIAAWGANARHSRVEAVLDLAHMDRLHALGVTKAGQPRHPLYLRADAAPTPWEVPA